MSLLAGDRFSQARTALEYVERVRNSPCTGGTEETLPVDFDHSVWSHYAAVAMRMSNLLTKLVIQGKYILGETCLISHIIRPHQALSNLCFSKKFMLNYSLLLLTM